MTEPGIAASDTPQHRYTAELAGEIERAWQQTWAESGTFNVPNPVGSLSDGFVEADRLVCARHQWELDPRTGACPRALARAARP